jgi:hypothetical protein
MSNKEVNNGTMAEQADAKAAAAFWHAAAAGRVSARIQVGASAAAAAVTAATVAANAEAANAEAAVSAANAEAANAEAESSDADYEDETDDDEHGCTTKIQDSIAAAAGVALDSAKVQLPTEAVDPVVLEKQRDALVEQVMTVVVGPSAKLLKLTNSKVEIPSALEFNPVARNYLKSLVADRRLFIVCNRMVHRYENADRKQWNAFITDTTKATAADTRKILDAITPWSVSCTHIRPIDPKGQMVAKALQDEFLETVGEIEQEALQFQTSPQPVFLFSADASERPVTEVPEVDAPETKGTEPSEAAFKKNQNRDLPKIAAKWMAPLDDGSDAKDVTDVKDVKDAKDGEQTETDSDSETETDEDGAGNVKPAKKDDDDVLTEKPRVYRRVVPTVLADDTKSRLSSVVVVPVARPIAAAAATAARVPAAAAAAPASWSKKVNPPSPRVALPVRKFREGAACGADGIIRESAYADADASATIRKPASVKMCPIHNLKVQYAGNQCTTCRIRATHIRMEAARLAAAAAAAAPKRKSEGDDTEASETKKFKPTL